MMELSDNDILVIVKLSDNTGYSKKALSESKTPAVAYNTLTGILDRLETGFDQEVEILDGPPFIRWFNFGDIKDPSNLATKFLAGRDPLSRAIRNILDEATKKFLDECDDKRKLRIELCNILNHLVETLLPSDDPNLLANIKLSEETKNFMDEKPSGRRLYLLNRMILEDAYSNEIAKRRKPIVIKGESRKSKTKGSEEPYFLNEDLFVFKLIIDHFNMKKKAIYENKLDLILQYEENYKKLYSSKNANMDRIKKLNYDFENEKAIFWEKAKKNDTDHKIFLRSEYTYDLLKEYGLLSVLDIMKSLDVEKAKLIFIAKFAREKKNNSRRRIFWDEE